MKRRFLAALLAAMMLISPIPGMGEVAVDAGEIQAEPLETTDDAVDVAVMADDELPADEAVSVIVEDEAPADEAAIVPGEGVEAEEEAAEASAEAQEADLADVLDSEAMEAGDADDSLETDEAIDIPANIPIDAVNFPDPNFRAYVRDEIAEGKSYLTQDQAKKVWMNR